MKLPNDDDWLFGTQANFDPFSKERAQKAYQRLQKDLGKKTVAQFAKDNGFEVREIIDFILDIKKHWERLDTFGFISELEKKIREVKFQRKEKMRKTKYPDLYPILRKLDPWQIDFAKGVKKITEHKKK